MFYSLYDQTIAFYNYYSTHKVNDPNELRDQITLLDNKLKLFLKLNINDKIKFTNEYCCELSKIHLMLVGKIAKYYFPISDINIIRVIHDRLFAFLDIKNPAKRFQYIPTQIFTEFIKGITYFANEKKDVVPIYHREISCGDKSLTLKDKYDLLITNDNSVKKRKKTYIKKCYLERLIYDKIYIDTMYQQDIGHLHELKETERLYDNYFPNETTNIKVLYNKANPIKLKIYIEKNMKMQIEYYTKVGKNVHCVLVDENHKVFEKIQSFDEESPWLSTESSHTDLLDNDNVNQLGPI